MGSPPTPLLLSLNSFTSVSEYRNWRRQLQQQGSPTFMRNPRNMRRPRATPDGSHATGITPISVLQRETAGFNSHDSLATINSVTRLDRVHLHYGSHFRSFYTLHNSLPPHAVKLLDSRTEIRENPGISPGGFIFIYARLVAYHANRTGNIVKVRCLQFLNSAIVFQSADGIFEVLAAIGTKTSCLSDCIAGG